MCRFCIAGINSTVNSLFRCPACLSKLTKTALLLHELIFSLGHTVNDPRVSDGACKNRLTGLTVCIRNYLCSRLAEDDLSGLVVIAKSINTSDPYGIFGSV